MDLEHYRQTLRALEHELVLRKIELDRHGREGLPADFAEQAVARGNDEVVACLGAQVERDLAAVNAALARIDLGTYGTCTRCGRDIAPARLEILPYTATCSHCA